VVLPVLESRRATGWRMHAAADQIEQLNGAGAGAALGVLSV
jgi:hypothetical protein